MDASRGEPARACDAFDLRRPPDTRHDQGPTRREIHHLPRPNAPDGMQVSLDEKREMSLGTQAPIGHEHIPWW